MLETEHRPTILVVEDEEAPRLTFARILKDSGFHVLVAASGVEALAVATGCGTTIDLVMLDMVMPEMSGEQTFLALHNLHPTLPVLICTGSDENEAVHRLLLTGYCAKLTKPFPAEALLEKVQGMLAFYPQVPTRKL